MRSARDHLSELVERVEREHDRVVITRNGREAAVLVGPEDLAELEETLSVLGDPEALAEIREADAASRAVMSSAASRPCVASGRERRRRVRPRRHSSRRPCAV